MPLGSVLFLSLSWCKSRNLSIFQFSSTEFSYFIYMKKISIILKDIYIFLLLYFFFVSNFTSISNCVCRAALASLSVLLTLSKIVMLLGCVDLYV